MAECLTGKGFTVLNEVVFNQIHVKCETEDITKATLKNLQLSGICWCGGAVWKNEPVIRISVCSWQTTRQDIDDCVETFVKCRDGSYRLSNNDPDENRSIITQENTIF